MKETALSLHRRSWAEDGIDKIIEKKYRERFGDFRESFKEVLMCSSLRKNAETLVVMLIVEWQILRRQPCVLSLLFVRPQLCEEKQRNWQN